METFYMVCYWMGINNHMPKLIGKFGLGQLTKAVEQTFIDSTINGQISKKINTEQTHHITYNMDAKLNNTLENEQYFIEISL